MRIIYTCISATLLAIALMACNKKADVTPVTPPAPPAPPVVGQAYDGGYVVYLDNTGLHGLMAAASDLPTSSPWGCEGTLVTASGSAYRTGLTNTDSIVNGCSTTGIAARLCRSLVSGGHSDWFMPSKDELDSIYVNLYLKSAGSLSRGYYWSSTEDSPTNAWFEFFDSTSVKNRYAKSTAFFVRPVRFF